MVRLQRLGQLAPGLVVNLECEELRKRSDWDEKMTWYIKGHDLFYLFWSPDALKSDAVEREWQCALSQGGSDFLSAVVVEGDAPPPAALKYVPFYRWDREQAVS